MLKPIKGRPGVFLEPASGKVLKITDYREGLKYDTVALPSQVDAPDEYVFFKNIERKPACDCNISQPCKLMPGEDMLIDRVGLFVRLAVAQPFPDEENSLVVIENSHLRIEINQLLFLEGPSIIFQPGYGYTNVEYAAHGEPSPVLVGKTMRPQFINHRHDFVGYLNFGDRNWAVPSFPGFIPGDLNVMEFDPPTLVTCFLHGLIRDAVTK